MLCGFAVGRFLARNVFDSVASLSVQEVKMHLGTKGLLN